MKFKFTGINNPRTKDGGFTDIACDCCGCKASAYLNLEIDMVACIICKGCLLKGVDIINDTILQDSIEKRRLK